MVKQIKNKFMKTKTLTLLILVLSFSTYSQTENYSHIDFYSLQVENNKWCAYTNSYDFLEQTVIFGDYFTYSRLNVATAYNELDIYIYKFQIDTNSDSVSLSGYIELKDVLYYDKDIDLFIMEEPFLKMDTVGVSPGVIVHGPLPTYHNLNFKYIDSFSLIGKDVTLKRWFSVKFHANKETFIAFSLEKHYAEIFYIGKLFE